MTGKREPLGERGDDDGDRVAVEGNKGGFVDMAGNPQQRWIAGVGGGAGAQILDLLGRIAPRDHKGDGGLLHRRASGVATDGARDVLARIAAADDEDVGRRNMALRCRGRLEDRVEGRAGDGDALGRGGDELGQACGGGLRDRGEQIVVAEPCEHGVVIELGFRIGEITAGVVERNEIVDDRGAEGAA